MSMMPDVGTVVRLLDGRIAKVIKGTPLCEDDRVCFEDGHEERIDTWQIHEVLIE